MHHAKDRTNTASTIPTLPTDAGQANEALRRVIASQVGPRKPGFIYRNVDGVFEVINVTTDRAEARRLLNRQSAQFAITVLNRLTGAVDTIGSVWTSCDQDLTELLAVTV